MRHRSGHPMTALAALFAVAVYSLCCKPAWSPKGDQVAYIYGQGSGNQTQWGVAIFDPAAKQNRVVAWTEMSGDSGLVPIEVFWPKNGHEIVYVSAPNDNNKESMLQVSTCDLQTGSVRHSEKIAVPKVSPASGFAPMFLQGKRWLWLQSEEACLRVDLRGGKVTALGRSKMLFKGGNSVYYAGESTGKGVEFGRIRTFPSLKERPLFIVKAEDGEELSPLPGMPERCTRFACLSKSGDMKRLRIYDVAGRCLKTIPLPDHTDSDNELPMWTEWMPDGTRLWVATKGTDSGVEYTGIGEVNLADGALRIIKINSNSEYGDLKPLQLSLSPSGACLAVSTLKKENIGLCLVDLTSDERKVTFVPPASPLSEAKAGSPG